MNAVGEIDAESPTMRSQMVSVHQRSPGTAHAMETHWEESGPISRYANKHSRSIIEKISITFFHFVFIYKFIYFEIKQIVAIFFFLLLRIIYFSFLILYYLHCICYNIICAICECLNGKKLCVQYWR